MDLSQHLQALPFPRHAPFAINFPIHLITAFFFLLFFPQGIYSCFNGVQNLESPVRVHKPDVTANSAQANVLKMLQAAKNMVSTASVGNSLENATRTIENWSNRSENLQTTFSLRTPQLVVQNTGGPNRPDQFSSAAATEKRPITPLLPMPQQPLVPASEIWTGTSEQPQILHPVKFRGSFSEDKVLPGSTVNSSPRYLVRTTPQTHVKNYVPVGNHLSAAPHSPVGSLREFLPPQHKHKLPISRGKERFHQNVHLVYGEGGHDNSAQMARLVSTPEKRKDLENHFLPHACVHNSFPRADRTSRPLMYKEFDTVGPRREKQSHRHNLPRPAWEQYERSRSLGLWKHHGKPSVYGDAPDLFPKAGQAPKTSPVPGIHHGIHHYPPNALRPSHTCNRKCVEANSLPWKDQQLLHSQTTRLPSYREACLQNTSGMHRASSTVVHKQYAYMNSYTNLPLYWGHLYQGFPRLCEQSSATQHSFTRAPCSPCSRDFLAHEPSPKSMYFGSTYRDCRERSRVDPTFLQLVDTDRRDFLTTQRMYSPCATRSWRRISSLESEV